MKIRSAKTALALSSILTLCAGASLFVVQPGLQMSLKVGGKEHDVTVGEPFKITVGKKTLETLLTTRSTQVSRGQGLSFEYPNDLKLRTTNSNVTPQRFSFAAIGRDASK